jgi:hypothetical protein
MLLLRVMCVEGKKSSVSGRVSECEGEKSNQTNSEKFVKQTKKNS